VRYRVDRAGAVANEFLEINIVDVLDIHKDFKDLRFKTMRNSIAGQNAGVCDSASGLMGWLHVPS